jgi:hypothetical protein
MGRPPNEAAQIRRLLTDAFGRDVRIWYMIARVKGVTSPLYNWSNAEAALAWFLPRQISFCALSDTTTLTQKTAFAALRRCRVPVVEAENLEIGRKEQIDYGLNRPRLGSAASRAEIEAQFHNLDLPFMLLLFGTGSDGKPCIGFCLPVWLQAASALGEFKECAAAANG